MNLSRILNHPIVTSDQMVDLAYLLALGVLLTKGKTNDKADLLVSLLQGHNSEVMRNEFQRFLEAQLILSTICIPALFHLDAFPDISKLKRD